MGSIYIVIILLFRVVQHLFDKKSSNMVNSMQMFVSYGAFRQLASSLMGLVLILIAGNGFKADGVTVLISVFSGFMLAVSMCCGLFAMQSGTIAICSMFATAGLIIPCVAGVVLFDTPMSIWQWGGIVLFFGAAYLLATDARLECGNFSLKTVALLVGSLLSNGFVMLAQQMFTYYRPEGDVSVFSFLSFGIVGIFLFVLQLFMKKDTAAEPMPKKLILYGLLLSLAVFVINQLATESTALVPPAVLFSFINGGSTIIGAVIACLCFGERLTPRKIAGIVIGVASLIIIKAL